MGAKKYALSPNKGEEIDLKMRGERLKKEECLNFLERGGSIFFCSKKSTYGSIFLLPKRSRLEKKR